MRVFNLFSDPHLGTQRAAHTTRDSAQRLKDRLFTQAKWASEPYNSICLGDLFDKSRNDEATLVQGFEVAKRCIATLSGNHDLTNRAGVTTTLSALESVMPDDSVIIAPDMSEPYFDHLFEHFWIVPHHASQALFEKALAAAAKSAELWKDDKHCYLLIHANYDCPFDTEDSTLNLSPEHAEELLGTFDRIFTGHDHHPKTFFDDRLVVVGNTMPTSFGDISDKFRWELDVETNELERVRLWDKSHCYREIEYGSPVPDLTGVQFVDVIGTEPVESGVEVADYVRSVWESGNVLIAVRNNVEIQDHLAGQDDVDTTRPALVDLKQRIFEDLEGSDLQSVYQHLLQSVESE